MKYSDKPAKTLVQYFGKESFAELKPLSGPPPAKNIQDFLNLPLVSTDSCVVKMGDMLYQVDKEGLYRFFDILGYDMRQMYVYRDDLWQLAGNLSRMRVHGWRGLDGPTFAEKVDRMRKGQLAITCGPTATFMVEQLRALGLKCRFVCTLTIDEWNDYSNGHSLTEIFDLAEKRWVFYDSDLGCRLRYQGRWLDLGDVCRLYREGQTPEPDFPAGRCRIDTSSDRTLPDQRFFYSILFEDIFQRDAALHKWYRRVMQIPVIDGAFPSDSEPETLRARSYANGNYARERLSWNEWRKRFYGN